MDITSFLIEQWPSLAGLGILLIFSGFFSGSETALFSLSRYDRSKLKGLSPKISHIVKSLLTKQEQLLLVILFCNMAVNILFFSISSVLIYRCVQAKHPLLASVIGVGSLLLIIFFGEILPKAWAFNMRITASTIVAGPIWLLVRILQLPLTLIHTIFILPSLRLIIGVKRESEPTRAELITLMNLSHKEGHLHKAQLELLSSVMDLRDLMIRQIMIPRVKMQACDIHKSIDEAKQLIQNNSQTHLPIYVFKIDNIVGYVDTRSLWTQNPKSLREILKPINFVPEFQHIDQLLHFFYTKNTNVAIVVDEYGGVVGMVNRDGVIEQLLEEIKPEFAESKSPEIICISGEQKIYYADGHLPAKDFYNYFNLEIPEEIEAQTLAGLLMHLMGHLPEKNETLNYQNLSLSVHTYEKKSLLKIKIIDHRNNDAE